MRLVHAILLAFAVLCPRAGVAQEEVPDWLLDLRLPNAGAKSIMSPTGWGVAYRTVFAGFGVSERNPWLPSSDGVAGFGIGVGDPVLQLGLQAGVTVSDLSQLDNYAYSFKLHRYLGGGTAIAVGGESLFTGGSFVDDLGETFYGVVSHVVQRGPSARPGVGALHLSIGAGTGRFANTSERDASEGKTSNGTVLFANAALEVSPDLNVILEWSGINLHVGVNKGFLVDDVSISLTVALADLTAYSGDGTRLLLGGALAVGL